MDDPSTHIIEQRFYLFSTSFFLAINNILGRIIFVPGGNNECSNRALNVVYFSVFLSFANIESYNSALRGLFTNCQFYLELEALLEG